MEAMRPNLLNRIECTEAQLDRMEYFVMMTEDFRVPHRVESELFGDSIRKAVARETDLCLETRWIIPWITDSEHPYLSTFVDHTLGNGYFITIEATRYRMIYFKRNPLWVVYGFLMRFRRKVLSQRAGRKAAHEMLARQFLVPCLADIIVSYVTPSGHKG